MMMLVKGPSLCESVDVPWPDEVRVPVAGELLIVADDTAGLVDAVRWEFDEARRPYAIVTLR